jgi:hypothetical protein
MNDLLSTTEQTDAPPPRLSADQLAELEGAQRELGKLRRAAGVAKFNSVTSIVIGIFAGFGVLIGLILGSFDGLGLVVTVGLLTIAWNEGRARKKLLQLVPGSARQLGWNQLAFLALIAAYCLYQIFYVVNQPNAFDDAVAQYPEMADTIGSLAEMSHTVGRLIYQAVLAISVVTVGGNAWYYFACNRRLDVYLAETPSWVLDIQRVTHGA